jgi:hypothetical protein
VVKEMVELMTNVEVGGICSCARRSSEGNGCMKLELQVAGSRPVEGSSRRDKVRDGL